MATLEEQVAYLEGKVNEQSQAFPAIRDTIGRLEQRIDARFDAVDRQFESIQQRTDARFDAIDDKVSRQFLWMVGIQITILIAVLGAVLSRG